MVKKLKKLDSSFENYEKMQNRHIKSFSNELRPDLEKQNFERTNNFENLKNDLTNMLYVINNHDQDDETLEITQDCRDRIESILTHDEILIKRLNDYRNELAKHLRKMGHGKKAMKSYLQNSKKNESPRFMDKSG